MELSSSKALLCLNTSGQATFALKNQGEWHCRGPLVILHYYDRQHPRAQTVHAPSDDSYAFGTAGTPSLGAKGFLHLLSVDTGVLRAKADFPDIQISILLEIRFTDGGDGFSIRIEDAGVVENMPGLYRILGLEVLPEFGAAATGESGYLTLPNWSGCQTFFDKSYPREVRQTIYSSNDQWEHVCNMGVFGITRAHGTLCGMVTAGDFDAELICRVHWEQAHANSIHPRFVYRWQQQDERIAGPREIRYTFAPAAYEGGEGYVFCGKSYREFLRRERGLLTWQEKAVKRPAVLDYRDRFFLKIFMAYKDPQADGRGPYHSTCTFAETREILEDCLKRGVTKLAVMLVGWGQDGHDGMPPTRFPVDERLGGEAAFRELIAWCAQHDVMLGVHDSYGESYACSPDFDPADVIRHRTGELWQGVIWSGGQTHKTCPSVFVDKNTKRDVPRVRALGIYGHHHIDAIGSFMTCYSKDHPLEQRADFAREVRRMFTFIQDEMGSVSTEMPFGPYFDVIDGLFHSYSHPSTWHLASPVGRHFLDRSIPLLSIVLHGSVNCGEGVDRLLDDPLHWLDWGLTPTWEVCMRPSPSFGINSYAKAAKDLAAIYARHFGSDNRIARLNALQIDGRWDLADGIARTLYSDGTYITVNRGSADWDGIPPNDCRIEESSRQRQSPRSVAMA
ncbi:MAG: DUF5696 domain-containing protein [Verrucomicrobiota bacterium]